MVTIRQGSIRRCDSRCYGAKGTVCSCICGGVNHGVGLDAAVAAELDRDVGTYKKKRDKILKERIETERRKRAAAAAQGDLFATMEVPDGE